MSNKKNRKLRCLRLHTPQQRMPPTPFVEPVPHGIPGFHGGSSRSSTLYPGDALKWAVRVLCAYSNLQVWIMMDNDG